MKTSIFLTSDNADVLPPYTLDNRKSVNRSAFSWAMVSALLLLLLCNLLTVDGVKATWGNSRPSNSWGMAAISDLESIVDQNFVISSRAMYKVRMAENPNPARIEAAIEAGTERLRSLQREDGSWNTRLTYDDALSAISIIALNYLKVPGVEHDHEALMNRYLSKMHPNGGFSVTPGGPPSKGASSIILLALTMLRDHGISDEYRSFLDDAIARTDRFITQGQVHIEEESYLYSGTADLLWDTVYPQYSDRVANLPLIAPLHNALLVAGLPKRLGAPLLDHSLPVYTLLAARQSHEQSPFSRWLDDVTGRGSEQVLVMKLLASQEANGAWWYSTMMTAMHAIALKQRGYNIDDPPLRRAINYLLASRRHWNGAVQEDHNDSSLWDTALMVTRLKYVTGQQLANFETQVLPQIITGGLSDGSYSFSLSGRIPDNDDTAIALLVLTESLGHIDPMTSAKVISKIRASVTYLLQQQQSNGGFATWGGRVVTNYRKTPPNALMSVLFDSSAPGITSRVLNALYAAQRSGVLSDALSDGISMALDQGLIYLHDVASEDGTWWSRWAMGRLAAFQCVPVLMRARGVLPSTPLFVRAREFLISHQNPDGGWGENVAADRNLHAAGRGLSTAVQTAWAVMGLIAVANTNDRQARRSLERGIEYMLSQMRNGDWSSGRQVYTFFSGLSYYEAPEWDNSYVLAALRLYQDYLRMGSEAAIARYILGDAPIEERRQSASTLNETQTSTVLSEAAISGRNFD